MRNASHDQLEMNMLEKIQGLEQKFDTIDRKMDALIDSFGIIFRSLAST